MNAFFQFIALVAIAGIQMMTQMICHRYDDASVN